MEQRCTCGAILPDDARFCHKCGKPQWEQDQERLSAETAAAPVAPSPIPAGNQPAPSGISFRNTRAVWISVLVAAGTLIALIAIALFLPPLLPVVLCGAGFVAARWYTGQSHQPLSAAGGARLGWMTGLWMFLVFTMMCAITAIVIASPEGWAQARTMWAQLPQASKLMTLSPHDFLMQLLIEIPFFFFLLTLLPGLGGMLGAKFSRRRPS